MQPVLIFLGYLAIGLADSYWVAYRGPLPAPLSLLLGITGKTFRIMLGYWLAGFLPQPGVRDDVERARQIDYLVRALSIQIGLVFVSAFIGKTLNMQEMSRFFGSSGYTIPFLYVHQADGQGAIPDDYVAQPGGLAGTGGRPVRAI